MTKDDARVKCIEQAGRLYRVNHASVMPVIREVANFGFSAGVAYAEGQWVRCEERLPERKEGWNHTDEVLVWYEGGEHKMVKYGIAYYHYDPPHRDPEWVDFTNLGRVPIMWQSITKPVSRGEADES